MFFQKRKKMLQSCQEDETVENHLKFIRELDRDLKIEVIVQPFYPFERYNTHVTWNELLNYIAF